MYDWLYTPDYYNTSTDYFFERNLFDIRCGDLIYSIQTKSYDCSSAASLASDNSKKVVQYLKDKGVFIKKLCLGIQSEKAEEKILSLFYVGYKGKVIFGS
ncbi:MAG: hypothetical protein ACKVOM_01490 [Ferruginibacter sp.]